MTWIYIVLLGVLVIMVITMLCLGRENFSHATKQNLLATFRSTVVGGTTTTKIFFSHRPYHSTNVVKLLGDNGKTVILVHNTPFDLQVWDPLYMYTQHAKNTGSKIPNLISYDMLGHNTAWLPVDPKYNDNDMKNYAWTYEDFISDLHDVYLQTVGTGKITLVGYGTGGAVAQAFGLEYPDIVEALYVLGTSIGPVITGIPDETPYLVQWLKKNPAVTYLTMEESFVRWNLCLWFQNNNPLQCPDKANAKDTRNTFDTAEFLLAQKLYRTGDSATYLQMDKMMLSTDYRPKWNELKLPFKTTFVVGNNDNFINLDTMRKDLEVVKKASPGSQMYVVIGKHGFPLIYPEYIYHVIEGNDMSKDPLTVEVVK